MIFMNFKTDTKEKFTVLSVHCDRISANLSEQLEAKIQELAAQPPYNVIVRMNGVGALDQEAAERLAGLRQEIYVQEHSLVFCELNPAVLEAVNQWEMDEALNITPTESEAWDIVQMDEIEREFLNNPDLE
jgi:anti-anti-sigma regulatory factor